MTDSTLAQLASMRKGTDNGKNTLSLAGLPGNVTRLGGYSTIAHRVDIQGAGDWDEDLEVPETFPALRKERESLHSASDLDFETPSLGSTSDATTSGSLPSDMRQRSMTLSSNPREPHSSVSSLSSSFASSPQKEKTAFLEARHAGPGGRTRQSLTKPEEDDFDLPGEVTKLVLSPSLGNMRSFPSLEQQQLLWGEQSSSPSQHSLEKMSAAPSESNSRESGAEDGESMLEGIDLPDQLFSRTREGAPEAASRLKAKLDVRKALLDSGRGWSRAKGAGSGAENDFSLGLIITDDLDLSPSRLKAKKLSSRIREAAHQRRKSRDMRAEGAMMARASEAGDAMTTSSAVSPLSPHKEMGKGEVDQSHSKTAGTSRLLASTAASRARERSARCASPRPSSAMDSPIWGRSTPTLQPETPGSSSRRLTPTTRRSQAESSGEASRSDSPIVGISSLAKPVAVRGGATRFSMPTTVSRERQGESSRDEASSTVSSPVVTRVMRGPKRARAYGDGKELDAIDDLPTIGRERVDSRGSSAQGEQAKRRDKQIAGRKPLTNSSPLATSTTPVQQSQAASRSRNKQTKRKQPTLIRNLGGTNLAPRVEGDMKWNPRLQRWEGNEEEGRNFENAVKGTGRPALITRLSVGSTNAVLGAAGSSKRSLGSSHSVLPPPIGARVVGQMVFDPIQLRWLNKNQEDEVDPFSAMNDDSDEEEQLQTKANVAVATNRELVGGRVKTSRSSASLRVHSDSDALTQDDGSAQAIHRALRGHQKEVPDLLADRIPAAIWLECLAAKARHDEEVAPFVPQRELLHNRRRPTRIPDRTGPLYLIQTLARKAMPE